MERNVNAHQLAVGIWPTTTKIALWTMPQGARVGSSHVLMAVASLKGGNVTMIMTAGMAAMNWNVYAV